MKLDKPVAKKQFLKPGLLGLSLFFSVHSLSNAAIVSTFAGVAGGADTTARTNYRNALGNVFTTEDFDTETSNNRFLDVNVENSVGLGLFTVFYTTTGAVNNVSIDIDGISPDFTLGLSTDAVGTNTITSLELRFASPINAFGSDFLNLDSRTSTLVTFTVPGQGSFSPGSLLDPTNTANPISGFVGFTTDAPFSVITISGPGNDGFSLNNVDLSIVPEPSSTFLLGIAGLGALLRRHRL